MMIEMFVATTAFIGEDGVPDHYVPDGFKGRHTLATFGHVMFEPNLLPIRLRCDEVNAQLVRDDPEIQVMTEEAYTPDPNFPRKRLGE